MGRVATTPLIKWFEQLFSRRLRAVAGETDGSASTLTIASLRSMWCAIAQEDVPYRAPSSSTPQDCFEMCLRISACSTLSLLLETGLPFSSKKVLVMGLRLSRRTASMDLDFLAWSLLGAASSSSLELVKGS